MEKSIYGLLNETEIDFTEYVELKLSSEEKEAHKQRILQEVSRMNQSAGKKSGHRPIWKVAAGMAAACAIGLVTVGITNPALAENMFSSVFGKLIDNTRGEKYEDEDVERFTKIGQKSVDVQQEVDKQQDAETYTTTAECNGVTISVSDIYCDGYVLHYTASLKTEDEGLNQADGIVTQFKEGASEKLSIEGMNDTSGFSRPFERAEDGTFVCANEMDLMSEFGDKSFAPGEEKTIVVNWTIYKLKGSLWDSWDEQGDYMETGTVEGEWHLRFPVTVDTSGNEMFVIDKEENGITVKDVVRTKAGLVVHTELPDFRKEPFNDPYNDPYIGIKDTQGNYLQWMSQKWEEHEDGTSESWIMVLYDGQKELSFEVTNKNVKDPDPNANANIIFQIP